MNTMSVLILILIPSDVGSMYDDIRLHVARSYTSSADSPFSLISSLTLSNHLLLSFPSSLCFHFHRPPSYVDGSAPLNTMSVLEWNLTIPVMPDMAFLINVCLQNYGRENAPFSIESDPSDSHNVGYKMQNFCQRIAHLHHYQWRIQSWSQGGFPKVANLSGW